MKMKRVDGLMLCLKDKTALLPGIYLKPKVVSSPYLSDSIVSCWLVWDGTLAECLKCPVCGYSVTIGNMVDALGFPPRRL